MVVPYGEDTYILCSCYVELEMVADHPNLVDVQVQNLQNVTEGSGVGFAGAELFLDLNVFKLRRQLEPVDLPTLHFTAAVS